MKTKLLLLLLLANFTLYAQTNLVPNAGLENWPGGILQDWSVTNAVTSSTDAAMGQFSAKLSYTTVSPKIIAHVPMKAGVTYTVKFKYKYVSSNFSGDHPIALNISKDGSANTLSNSTFAANNLWTEKENTFTADQDLTFDVSISTYSFDSKAFDILIDDVQVYVKGTEQYTLIPDIEFEKKLIALGIDSGTPDGKVQTLKVAAVTSLGLDTAIISDLTGLQDFTSLKSLSCTSSSWSSGSGGSGKLTSLDVSKNGNLTSLSCYNNKLTTLDVSKNTLLTSLNCSGNKLTALDVSKNVNLTFLDFGSSPITAMNISSNTALQTLRFDQTSLTTIDVSKNINLTSLNSLYTPLTSLDITKNVNLTSVSLRQNQLTSLDVSKNTALLNLTIASNKLTALDVSKNTALTNLQCFENQLTTLDISKNTALKLFSCETNKLTSLDASKNVALTNFNCGSNALLNLNLKNGKNTLLSVVNFKGNFSLFCIGVDDVNYANSNWSGYKENAALFANYDCTTVTAIPDAAFETKLIDLGIDTDGKNGIILNSSIAAITSLDLSGSSIVNLSGIQGFTALTTLNVSGNLLKRIDLSQNSSLKTLNTANNAALTCIQVADLSVAATWNTTKDATASFSLDCNVYTLIPDSKFEDKLIALGIDKDGKNGKVNSESLVNITSLDVSNSDIADLTGIQDFTNLKTFKCTGNTTVTGKLTKLDVSKNTKLTELYCSYNQLAAVDVTQNTLLTSLDLRGNKLVAADVTKNAALTYLNIAQNKLTAIDVTKNPALIYFYAEINDLAAIDLTQNTKLTNLNLYASDLVTIDLSKNINLTTLDVQSNKLTSLDLTKNLELSYLNCTGNEIAALDISKNIKMIDLQCDSNKLTALDLTKNTVLSTVDCSNNKISTLDLSQNTGLNILECGANAMTTLDVSKNITLKAISCYSLPIKTLDLSKNTLLTSLTCYLTDVTSLDVSKNINLTTIYCRTGKLTTLNVKNGKNNLITSFNVALNPDLKCILVDDVNYAQANWKNKDETSYFSNIDCSLVTPIADPKFEDKLIALNIDTDGKNGVVLTSNIKDLTSLDVSNSLITDLSGIQDFKALTNLNASNNALANLDLTKNSALNTLNISGNPALTCVTVADVAAAGKWSTIKDPATSFSLDCRPYTLIPDLNFEKRLIALELDKDGENGKVLTKNINTVTVLDLSSTNISDLTGIQDFTALTNLQLYNNKLTKLDVSKNTALTRLNFERNQVKSIDLSKNVLLQHLVADNNQLTSLDVSKNTALTNLECNTNSLTSLDVSKNLPLLYLELDSNNLSTIDLSKNSNLSILYISYNSLVTLDVSKNPKLFFLRCDSNKLTSLDLSQNPNLTEVLGGSNKLVNLNVKNGSNKKLQSTNGGFSFRFNPNLTCIQVDDVAYSNTAWSDKKDATAVFSSEACAVNTAYTFIPDTNFENKLIALGIDKDGQNGKVATADIALITSLNVSNSNIASLDGIADFGSLSTLDFSKNQVKSFVSSNKALTTLNCSQNQLNEINIDASTSLTNLNCSTNNLLVLNLSRNKNLAVLSASFNKFSALNLADMTSLRELDCAGNNLYALNIKNGNNANMQRMIFGNFTENPNLLCIQVDDAAYSASKWIAKDAKASYSSEACPENLQYTLIPDPNFEKVLIANNIDKDGVNGKVLTSSIVNLKSLSAIDTTNKITDLTGIEDFAALEQLYCSNGALTKLDVSKNFKLQRLDLDDNKVTTLDLSNNSDLEHFSSENNSLSELNVSKNPKLKTLHVSSNMLTTIDVSKNPALEELYIVANKFTDIDVTANLNLKQLGISTNKIAALNISKNTALISLSASSNELTSVDVSKNTAITSLILRKNQLTSIDISKNLLLSTLEVNENKIETIDVSKHLLLNILMVNSNQLTSLNLKNGKNKLLNNNYVSFYGNPKLTCILVDDVAYANANWPNRKDSFATYNTECTGELTLPANNFTVETKGESCLGENNGEISIAGKAAFAYTATINDKTYAFTNNSLKVTALTPGVYNIKITIPEMIFEQNFKVTIAKAATITGKSSLTSKKLDVEITEGTAPFTIFVDGTEQFQTTDSNFSLEVEKGGLIQVKTAKACEGVFSKKILSSDVLGVVAAYPNPTSGSFEIEIPTDKNQIKIEIYNIVGQLISSKIYTVENGKAQLNLEHNASGIYAAKIYLDTPEYLKIIKK